MGYLYCNIQRIILNVVIHKIINRIYHTLICLTEKEIKCANTCEISLKTEFSFTFLLVKYNHFTLLYIRFSVLLNKQKEQPKNEFLINCKICIKVLLL